tara:strand:+ start:94 stop:453 length:360 start_codon:yes stop_codon:yes gene_type:complete
VPVAEADAGAAFNAAIFKDADVMLPATVVLPLNKTLNASDLAPADVPLPIEKAVLVKLKLVAVLPLLRTLYCPIAVEAYPIASVETPITVEDIPLAVVLSPIAVESVPLAVVASPIDVE